MKQKSRQVGNIYLTLSSDDGEGGKTWTLLVERLDPYGGDPWVQDFWFTRKDVAERWFKGIKGDRDLDDLMRMAIKRDE